MANGCHPNRFPTVGQLIKDPIGPDPQRVETAEFSAKRITGKWVALQQPKRILDRIDQGPIQGKKVSPRAAGKDEPSQGSASSGSPFGQLAAELVQGDRLATLDLPKPCLQCRESIRIGKDLSRLLQRLVLVYWNKSRCGSAVAGDQHMIAPITDVI